MTDAGFDIKAEGVSRVLAELGFIPAIMPAVISERIKDAVDHHKRGVLKDARADFPGGRRAQKFLASRLYGYGRTTGSQLPTKMSQVRGESFAVEGREGLLENLERGGTRTSATAMAIPLVPRYQGARNRARWQSKLDNLEFDVIPGRSLLVETLGGRRRGGTRVGLRSEIVGFLAKRTTVRGLLRFFARWEQNLSRVTAKLDSDLEKAMTAAGRAALQTRIETKAAADRAYGFVKAEYLNRNPGDIKGAARAARNAARLVRADRLSQGGGA